MEVATTRLPNDFAFLFSTTFPLGIAKMFIYKYSGKRVKWSNGTALVRLSDLSGVTPFIPGFEIRR
jgi:hypothetical protein